MKSMLIALSLAALLSTSASGAARLDIYTDTAQTSCQLFDIVQQPPIVYVYYFLNGAFGATGVGFAAPKPACWTGATFGADDVGPRFGDSQVGLSIGFFCAQGSVYIGKTAYIVSSAGTPCCQVSAKPGVWGFYYTSCDYVEFPLTTGQRVTINPDVSCQCQVPLATESTSWGRVKSLYH